MKLLITGCLGHIGTYVLENINKLGKFSKIILVDSLKKIKLIVYYLLKIILKIPNLLI